MTVLLALFVEMNGGTVPPWTFRGTAIGCLLVLTSAIMFDLSDIIAAPSEAGEDSTAVEEAVEAPTVTESPEAVHAARAADEPILNQTPYEVQDEELKFGIATPEPEQETEEIAEEVAQEFEEEQIDQASQTGAVEAEASEASVSGVDAEAQAETAQAESEGLTAEQMVEITEWQKAVVLRIAKAKAYPQAARKKGLEGEVRVKFTIDRYGAVTAREVGSGTPGSMTTRSPTARSVTPSPTSRTVPAPSWPRIIGASTTNGPIFPSVQ